MYIINADAIVQISDNSGKINILQGREEKIAQINKKDSTIFDNIDEEIIRCKLYRPSEREVD